MSAEQSEQQQEQAAAVEEKQQQEERKAASPHPWEAELDSYPLREPEEDPGWAVKTVKIWLWVALASGFFILALILLGFIYD